MVKEAFKDLAPLNHSLYLWLSIVTHAPELRIQKTKEFTDVCDCSLSVYSICFLSSYLFKVPEEGTACS